MICISYNKNYYQIDLIGNNSVGKGPASAVKKDTIFLQKVVAICLNIG